MTTTHRLADVSTIDGRCVLIIDSTLAGLLVAALTDQIATRHRLGKGTPTQAAELLAAAKSAQSFNYLGLVPLPVPDLDEHPPTSGSWMTTEDAAKALHISRRAVTKAITTGRLTGRKAGRQWLVHLRPKAGTCSTSTTPPTPSAATPSPKS